MLIADINGTASAGGQWFSIRKTAIYVNTTYLATPYMQPAVAPI